MSTRQILGGKGKVVPVLNQTPYNEDIYKNWESLVNFTTKLLYASGNEIALPIAKEAH
jgi:hypothetical protein